MSFYRQLARKVGFAVFAAWLVLTLTFAFVTFTVDPNQGLISYAVQSEGGTAEEAREAIAAYREARNLDDPIWQRYAGWMYDIATLDWGRSFVLGSELGTGQLGTPVMELLRPRLPFTLGYLVPALVVSTAVGVLLGIYATFNRGSPFTLFAGGVSYLGFGVPNFFLAEVLAFVLISRFGTVAYKPPAGGEFWALDHLEGFVVPAFVLSTGLIASQIRYTRAESMEYVNADFVKLAKAKGASPARVARHVLRNAALPILSLILSEVLTVVIIHIYVIEVAFGIPGIADITLVSISRQDLPVILGSTMLVVFVGIAVKLFQDVAAVVLDPRIEAEG